MTGMSGRDRPAPDEGPVPGSDEDEPWWEDEEDPSGGYTFGQVLAECRETAQDQARADATAARLGLTSALTPASLPSPVPPRRPAAAPTRDSRHRGARSVFPLSALSRMARSGAGPLAHRPDDPGP
jgi:hypothetical protein